MRDFMAECCVRWDEMPWEMVSETIKRKVYLGKQIMMVLYCFEPSAQWPEERHIAEQAGYVIEGKIVLKEPDDGRETVLGPGDGYLIESNKKHSWRVLEEKVVLLDIFSPPRMELIGQS